jgi:hypothetical protein
MSEKKKTEKPARLANIITTDRSGEVIIGQIDKRTGKIVGSIEDKPKKAPKD